MSLILNIILSIIALGFFIKFVRFKKLAESEFENYEERIEDEVSKRKELELKYQSEAHYLTASHPPSDSNDIKTENEESGQNINSLISEIGNLRHEKEEELKLRLEAEKQIELALQKTDNAQKKIEEWNNIQSANSDNIVKAITEVNNDLYKKLIDFFAIKQPVKKADISQIKLEEILKSGGLKANSNYFMNYSIAPEVRKAVPCEVFIIFGKENCAIIDNKAVKIFAEFFAEKAVDEQKANENLKKKIDRYLSYLSNPKYRSNVINYFSAQKLISPKANSNMIMLLNSENDINEFKKIDNNYLQILQKNHIYLHSLDSIINLIKAPL